MRHLKIIIIIFSCSSGNRGVNYVLRCINQYVFKIVVTTNDARF